MEQNIVHDRISELPEVLRQHILSFLSTKQVVQSTLLSTAWKHVWITFPILRFDRIFFPTKWQSQKVKRKKPNLHKFVEKTSQIRKEKRLPINNFTLTDCWVEEKSVFCVYYWILFVFESDVQELDLGFGFCGYLQYFALPQPILIAKSLTVLTLRSLKLDLTSVKGDVDVNLPSLKQLSLTLVYTDDQIIQNLLAGCPVIEYINFESCHGFKSIKLAEVANLMTFRVKNNNCCMTLELAASNLSCLSIFQNLQSELNLLPFKNLKELNLHSSKETDKWLALHDHLSGFPLLETLRLNPSFQTKTIEISCHHLKTLELSYKCKMAEVKIDAPKLCRFSFCFLGGYIKSFSLNALALSYAFYGLLPLLDSYILLNDENIELLSKLNNTKLLELLIPSIKNISIPKELRETLPSPSYNVKHLKLSISQSFPRNEINKFLDSLLWIFPLPDILSMKFSFKSFLDFDQITLKFSYEKPIYEGENPSCCKFLPFLCWRHCLKAIKIESLTGLADGVILYKYFSENAKMQKPWRTSGIMLAQLLESKTLEDLWFHVGVIAFGVIGLRKCIRKDLREVSFGECRNWKVSHLTKSNIL